MTDQDDVHSLLSHAVEVIDRDHFIRAASSKQLRIKLGLDPTAPDIHLGHYVVLRKLKQFQDLGHLPVLIIGDFTAMIGDPSGRQKTRPVLTREQVQNNARTYLTQVGKVLDISRIEVRYNSEWLSQLGSEGLLRLCSLATVAQLIGREDFSKRLDSGQPVGVHELLYPLLQAYDSVAIKADVELGGTDQLFNLLLGREIQKAFGQEPQDVMVFPILEGLDGVQKMSKSLGNYVSITEPADQIYGKLMSIPDSLILRYAELLVDDLRIVEEIKNSMKTGRGRRDAKDLLGKYIVDLFYPKGTGERVSEEFSKVFKEELPPDQIPELTLDESKHVADLLLLRLGLVKSRREARRIIEQKGARVNGQLIDDAESVLQISSGDVVQVGKRKWVKVRIK
jgi:tyrosyl-tRNA synthetase